MSFKDVLAAKKAASAVTEPEPEVAPKTVGLKCRAANNSFKGYQWSGGILRPNGFGIYVAKNDGEAALLSQLVEAGVMQVVEE
jgi:hypothetical protein